MKAEFIPYEDLSARLSAPANDIVKQNVLPNEIDGMETNIYAVPEGRMLMPEVSEDLGRSYLFFSGEGKVTAGEQRFEINEIAFFAPLHNTPFCIEGTGGRLRVLELLIPFSETDLAEAEKATNNYPYFLTYSKCKTYKEKIKSEKTTSRTIMPEYTYPRLCIGSVETTGPDHVAAHEHPMLEQLFFGLKDNNCIVKADAAVLDFKENMLLHIPLGSSHSVDVTDASTLHYIWIDLFRDRSGMEWIAQEHVEE